MTSAPSVLLIGCLHQQQPRVPPQQRRQCHYCGGHTSTTTPSRRGFGAAAFLQQG